MRPAKNIQHCPPGHQRVILHTHHKRAKHFRQHHGDRYAWFHFHFASGNLKRSVCHVSVVPLTAPLKAPSNSRKHSARSPLESPVKTSPRLLPSSLTALLHRVKQPLRRRSTYAILQRHKTKS